jgi:hypothetical protein
VAGGVYNIRIPISRGHILLMGGRVLGLKSCVSTGFVVVTVSRSADLDDVQPNALQPVHDPVQRRLVWHWSTHHGLRWAGVLVSEDR